MTYTDDWLWAHAHCAPLLLELTQYGAYGKSNANTGPYIENDAYMRTGRITSPFWWGHGFRELANHGFNYLHERDPAGERRAAILEREW